MIGSLKTSLIQSGLSERRAGGGGGRRGRSEHKPWGIDWNRQCALSERLPRHRSCLRSLPVRDPDPANLVPLRDGDLNCVAQRVVEHFEGALRGQGLTPTRRQKIQEWVERVHETGASVDDVAELEKILKITIILRDIAGEDIYNSGKYQRGGNGVRGTVELIYHNGHAWSKDLHFQQSTEVHIYEGDVWHAIREVTQG